MEVFNKLAHLRKTESDCDNAIHLLWGLSSVEWCNPHFNHSVSSTLTAAEFHLTSLKMSKMMGTDSGYRSEVSSLSSGKTQKNLWSFVLRHVETCPSSKDSLL